MKVVAFNGSPRRNGNTADLLKVVCAPLQEAGIETEVVDLAGTHPRGCTACMQCFKTKNKQCAVTSDSMNTWIDKMVSADGIILASPTYFADVTSEMKALIDRAGMVARANENMHKRKVGAAVVAVRRAGAIHAFDTMNHFFLIGEMIVVGSSYWNIGVGRAPGEAMKDEEGVATARQLGINMGWLVKKLAQE